MNSSMASKFLLAITFFSIFFHFEVQSNGNGMKEEHSNAEQSCTCLVQKSSSVLTVPNALLLIEEKSSRAPYFSFRWVPKFVWHGISLDDIANLLNNKVLVAATVSAAIGQLLKPLTSTIFYGRKFDFKAVVQAGGFPSTHSSAVVAIATSLALERGFSDAIFGLAVVYASLIMYDAQGVRREVGTHAKQLNKFLLAGTTAYSTHDANDITNSFPRDSSSNIEKINTLPSEEETSFQTNPPNSSLLVKSDDRIQSTSFTRSSGIVSDVSGGSESLAYGLSPLKESIGHTEVEVIGGALLGFLVTLAIFTYA